MGFLKVDKSKVKVKSETTYSQSKKIGFMLAAVVVVIIGFNFFSSFYLRQQVDIVKLRTSLPQDAMITEDNLVRGTMIRAEYQRLGLVQLSDQSVRRAIVLWEDRGRIINTYAVHFIRHTTPIYWDSLGRETPRRFSYLYKMDGELLRIGVSPDDFGEMIVPGDRVNVRVTYTEQSHILPTEREFVLMQQTGVRPQTTTQRQIVLFSNTPVIDMLNGDGESIFDIYYSLLAQPKNVQREIANSVEFLERVRPSHILLNVTPEEADRYMYIQGKGPTFMMTLLPRTGGNMITEALNELQTGFQRRRE